jgi:hypothetical protein
METKMTNESPSYYAIIPANVRYCKELEPSAKLLYGEITALCNREGYCWATNNYFAELYEVDTRTIQRCIKSLKENDFIFIPEETPSFNSKRKIFINQQYQISSTERQNCHPPRQNCHTPPDKNVTHNIKENNTLEKQQQQPAAALPKPEKKELKDPINVNLLYINIPDSEKRWISEHYEDADIRHAVAWAQHSETKITSTLEQAIKWACKTKPEMPKEKISVYEELCKIFKHGQKYNGAECILNQKHFALERGMKNEYVKLDEYFTWSLVQKICENFGVNFKRK